MVRKHHHRAGDFTWHAGGAFRTALARRLYLRNILRRREILFAVGIAIDAHPLGLRSRIDDSRAVPACGSACARNPDFTFAGLLQELHRPQVHVFMHFNRLSLVRI